MRGCAVHSSAPIFSLGRLLTARLATKSRDFHCCTTLRVPKPWCVCVNGCILAPLFPLMLKPKCTLLFCPVAAAQGFGAARRAVADWVALLAANLKDLGPVPVQAFVTNKVADPLLEG